jgi:CHAT domain-containing protein/tetratricopeptide (TPR) repeat protein
MTRAPSPHLALLLLGVLTAATASCARDAGRAGGDELRTALAAALGPARVLEARLSIAPEHVPCDGAPGPHRCRPLPAAGSAAHRAVLELAAQARDRARAARDPDALWTAGLIELLWSAAAGNTLDPSIQLLEEAALLAPERGDLLADLAAARLTRAAPENPTVDLLMALDAAERGRALAPGDPAALHNRALALERLGLAPDAALAWRGYLGAAGSDDWRGEAASRAARLDAAPPAVAWGAVTPALARDSAAALARRDPQGARVFALDVALPAWGAAFLAVDAAGGGAGDDHAAGAWLGLAGGLADGLVDRSVAGIVAEIGRAGAARRGLANALVAYGRARERYRAGDPAAAAPHFEAALAELPSGTCPLRGWSLFHRGAAQVYGGRHEEALVTFARVLRDYDSAAYPALAGSALWSREVTRARQRRQQRPLEGLTAAAHAFATAGEAEHGGAVLMLQEQARLALEGPGAALEPARAALAALAPLGPGVWLHNTLIFLGERAAELDLDRAAVVLQTAGIEAARGTAPVHQAEAWTRRARLLARAGRTEDARADLDSARAAEQRVTAPASRSWLHGDRSIVLARLGDASELDRAVDFFESVHVPGLLIPALAARAASRAAGGRGAEAEADLDRAIALVEGQLALLDDARQRASVLHAADSVYAAMVQLQLRLGRPDAALAHAERGRAVLGGGGASAIRGDDVARWSRALPEGHVVLAYALLSDTLAIWTLRRERRAALLLPLAGFDLRAAAERVRAAASRGADARALDPELDALWRRLIAPVAEEIAGATTLLVASGPALAGIPFPALRNPVTGAYLVETHELRLATGLERAVGGSAQVAGAAGTGPVLLVGAGSGTGPRLPPLPGAEAELEALRAVHRNARLLAGGRAGGGQDAGDGDDALRSNLEAATLVHFATHAVSMPDRPGASYLLAGGGAGRLTADEIRRLRLDRLRLAVLAACNTATPGGVRGGGFSALSDAFLAAGAGGVVGTLWAVEDGAARALMHRFHADLAAGATPPAALAAAQRALLAGGDERLRSPAAWAGFLYVGS